MFNTLRGIGLRLLAATFLFTGMPRPAFAGQEISCESHGMRRAYCSTGRHGTVRLLDSKGIWPCKENETWGTETEGIWVDQGCKGRFFVDDDSGNGKDKHTAAIVAGVVGVGILAAILASKNKRDDNAQPDRPPEPAVPGWFIGEFHGYTPANRTEATMRVGTSGRVFIQAGRETARGVWAGNNQVRFDDGAVYTLTRNGDALRLTNNANRNAFTDYYRDR